MRKLTVVLGLICFLLGVFLAEVSSQSYRATSATSALALVGSVIFLGSAASSSGGWRRVILIVLIALAALLIVSDVLVFSDSKT